MRKLHLSDPWVWGLALSLLLGLGLSLYPGSLWAQRNATIPNPDPEEERRTFVVPEGFEVNLFAADPLLAKPIHMNFDPSGRLWLACSESYPQIKPGQDQNDKIVILEDTKGAGKADKVTVFAEGLLIPTGIEVGDGGCYVVDSTDLVHLSSSKGDGKADRRRVVLSGFGTEDTHHMVHSLRWGHDGMLYFNQSIYIHSHIETPYGPRRLGGGGIWQLRPETGQLEVYARGWVNSWGHHFDRWGQSFVTDGAGGEGINYAFPGAAFATANNISRILPGLNPGSPKDCGLEVVSGRHLPESWQGSLITNDFRAHRVCRYVVTPEGAGYTSREQTELIKSNHPAFRPIDVKMGPDGAIYIADWYNPIIQHGEVDFRDPRRDHTRGRIWRVTVKNRPLVPRPQLVGAPVPELLEQLKAPEGWTRHMAKRVLKERGASQVIPFLAAWCKSKNPAVSEEAEQLLEGLWTYQSLDIPEPELLGKLLRVDNYHIRAAATRVLYAWAGRLSKPLDLLKIQVQDENPQVRLEAIRALSRVADPHAVELALLALNYPVDRWLDYALWLTCRDLQPVWMPAFLAGNLGFQGDSRRLLFALQALGSQDVLKPVVELVRAGKIPAEAEPGVLGLISKLGNARDLSLILNRLNANDTRPALRLALLRALQQAYSQRRVSPEGDLNSVARLLEERDEEIRAEAARLAGLWQLEAVRPLLTKWASDPGSSERLRQSALDGLVGLKGSKSLDTIKALCLEEKETPTNRQLAWIALANLDMASAVPMITNILNQSRDGKGTDAIFEAVLLDRKGSKLLAQELLDKSIPEDVARTGLRVVRSTGRPAPELVEALTRAGKLSMGPRKLSRADLDSLVQEVIQSGNPARGESIYRRKDMLCMKCHAIGGAGGQVGPDMTSIGGSAPVDYLIESLLEPNKAVKEGYHSLLITTTQGKQFSGIKIRETPSELILRTPEDKEVTIAIRDIEEKSQGGSLMPQGLTDALTRAELIDLVRFLSELGKQGPYSASKVRMVRRWEALDDSSETRSLLEKNPTAFLGVSSNLTWNAIYSTVGGILPLSDLPKVDPEKRAVVRFQVDVTTAGEVQLKMANPSGITLWLNEQPLNAREKLTLKLPVGMQTLTLKVDPTLRTDPLRVELDEEPGSAVRFRVVGGK